MTFSNPHGRRGGGRYITHGGELVGAPPILSRTPRDLEDREKQMQLEIERKLDAKRKANRESAQKELAEEHRLKEAEKEQQLAAMRKQIDDLKRKVALVVMLPILVHTILGSRNESWRCILEVHAPLPTTGERTQGSGSQ